MANKPVLEIEVNDAAFQRFVGIYNEYRASLDDMPDVWAKINASMAGGGDAAKDSLALAAAQAGLIAEALANAVSAQKSLGSETHSSAKGMASFAKSAKGAAKEIVSIGSWLLKLSAVGLGLGAIGSGFGFDALAGAALTRTRASRSLGLTPGQLASFQINAQQFLDPGALNAAAAAQTDISKAGLLKTLGINFAQAQNESASDLAFEMLRNARASWVDATKRGLSPMQMPAIMAYQNLGGNVADIRNAANTPLSELDAAQRRSNRDAAGLGFDAATSQAWIGLKLSLDRAGMTIESGLIRALAPLAPKIEELSTAVVKFIAGFLDGPQLDQFIKNVAGGLQQLDDFLEKTDWRAVGADVSQFASEVVAALRFLHLIPDKPVTQSEWEKQPHSDYDRKNNSPDQVAHRKSLGWLPNVLGIVPFTNPDGWVKAGKAAQNAWKWLNAPLGGTADAALISAINAQEGGLHSVNKDTGALGKYQFLPSTGDSYLTAAFRKKYGNLESASGKRAFLDNVGGIQDTVMSGYFAMLKAHAKKIAPNRPDLWPQLIAAGHYGGTGGMDALLHHAGWTSRRQGPHGRYPSVMQYASDVADRAAGITLKNDFDRYHSWKKAAAAYLAGSGALDADIHQHGGNWLRYLPNDVRKQVEKATAGGSDTNPANLVRVLSGLKQKHTAKPALNVKITNSTAARVAVSLNAVSA
jgi:hypothetical protein